jgi:hypothetical protein
MQPSGVKKKNLSDEERSAILQVLLARSKNKKLSKGMIKDIATEFQRCTKTISRIWSRANQCIRRGMKFADVRSRIKGNSGCKKLCRQALQNKILALPKCERITMRSISKKTSISLGTLCN